MNDEIELICPNCGRVSSVPGYTTTAEDGSYRPCSWKCRLEEEDRPDQSGREPDDTEEAERVLRDALGDDYHSDELQERDSE